MGVTVNANTRKTLEAIRSHPTPRDLDWSKFTSLWESIAEEVEEESGSRLVVKIAGKREVFHRPNDGTVTIEDVQRARDLLDSYEESQEDSTEREPVLVVAIDDKSARVLNVELDGTGVDTEEIGNPDSRGRHRRTVEKHTNQDTDQENTSFYDDLARYLSTKQNGRNFVVFGNGQGQANTARQFVERLQDKHPAVASKLVGVDDNVDLSAATDAQLGERVRRFFAGV